MGPCHGTVPWDQGHEEDVLEEGDALLSVEDAGLAVDLSRT